MYNAAMDIITNSIETVKSTKRAGSPEGCQCYFLSLDDDWGIKVYYNENVRDDAHNRQTLAAEHGLGPEVGDTFEVGDKFCYVTEKVELLVPYSDDNEYWDMIDEMDAEMEVELKKVRQELLDTIGWEFHDNHSGNIGIDAYGKFICIDFGG